MENQTTETQTQTTTAPAPVTDKAQVTPAPAPVTTDKTAPETVAKTPSETKPEDPKDFARKAFQHRQEKRVEKKASEELAEMRQKYAELEAKLNQTKPVEPEPEAVSLLDDPEKALAQSEERATKRVLGELERRQKEYEAQVHYRQVSEKAADFLLTRSHLKEDPALKEAVLNRIEEKYLHLAAENGARDPQSASRLAYLDICAEKGIVPDMEGFKHVAPMNASGGKATSGVSPSAPAGGKKSWSRAEAEKYLMEGAKSGQLQARRNEIDEAKREGRIK